MKKILFIYFLFFVHVFFSQVDYSNSWEDFYSYNNVKDFVKVDNIIYALVDNAVFTFNENTLETKKFSSVQGLSGETTSAIFYSNRFKRLVIGYENGLLEVIDQNGDITISSDISSFNQTGVKRINHFSEFENTLYLSTSFAIVAYDIENLEFGDTFFIGNNSTSLQINETLVVDNFIYAATEDGIFRADVTDDFLIDFNSWQQLFPNREFSRILKFNEAVYVSENNILYRLQNNNLTEVRRFSEPIVNLNASPTNLTVTLTNSAIVLDSSIAIQEEINTSNDFSFTLSDALFLEDKIYLATHEFGILSKRIRLDNQFSEIHPEGPLSNEVFSIAVNENDLWVVYGGYNVAYTPTNTKKGFSHYTGENWINTKFDESIPADLVHVTIDPSSENKVYISALGISNNLATKPTGGLLVVENDVITQMYNHLNSTFTPIAVSLPSINIRVSSSAIDRQGNIWATNYETSEELKKLSFNGQWSSIDLSSIVTNSTPGLNEITIDNNSSVWIGTRTNGVYVYNENGNRKKALVATPNLGNLPDLNVTAIAVDKSNRVWLGTRSGMVVLRNASSVFDSEVINAQPIIIEENGVGERLLGDQKVNTIKVDGADNKWFGTDNGGVLYTNPSGQNTLANFSKQNSPLPSNRILKVAIDNTSGKVYFATDKGVVAYNSNVVPFGDRLTEVYAYPNPVLKNHNTVTITGRNGNNLPKGTNVKILDVAGYLVYETNVVEGQELQGGKVVWDKRNLAGTPVASGVYIVLLSNDDASETTTTKIAIVN